MEEQRHASHRKESIVGTAALGALWTYLTLTFARLNRQGESWAGLAAMLTAILAITTGLRLFALSDEFFAARGRFRAFMQAGQSLAGAREATLKEMEEEGLLNRRGLLLGNSQGKDLRYDGECSVLLLGPPKSAKSTSVLLSSLFPSDGKCEGGMMGIGHNVLINDPNGEIFCVMEQTLRAMNVRLFTVTPFYRQLSLFTGRDIRDAGCNFWPDLRLDDDPKIIRAIVVDRAELLVLIDSRMDAKDRFFKGGGRTFAEWLQEYIIAGGKIPTLAMMHKLVSEGAAGIIERCREVLQNKHLFSGGFVDRSASILGYATTAGEQFAGYLGSCEEGLRLYDAEGLLGDHFTPDGLDPSVLKDDQPTVVFIMYPTQKARSHQLALGLTYMHFVERLAADRRVSHRCTIFADEASGVGCIPNLPNWISEYRKFGLRWVLAYQEAAGQIEKAYGAPTVKEIFAACEVIWASNVREESTLRMLSAACGETVIDDRTMTDGKGIDGQPNASPSYGRSHKTRPLFRPDDIHRLPKSQALVLCGNMHPIILDKVPYWSRTAWAEAAGDNPYRQG